MRRRLRRAAADRDATAALWRPGGAGQHRAEYAVPERGLGLVLLDRGREDEAALEAAVGALRLAALLVGRLSPLQASQRQNAIINRELDVLLVQARQVSLDTQALLGLDHLDARMEADQGSALVPLERDAALAGPPPVPDDILVGGAFWAGADHPGSVAVGDTGRGTWLPPP